jgi:N6-L-threonylcarbamoyladenine synthase
VILALETSCDDTCAAVLDERGRLRSSIRASQDDLHGRFGGVVPEIASRRHLELVVPAVRAALDDAGIGAADLSLVAATQGPGLVGALLVGLSAGKALAYARGLPFAPVDHLRGHVAALDLSDDPPQGAFLCLLASGGHTLLLDVGADGALELLGGTLDDAAGEAFDKGARLLDLPYPGGPALERLARAGDDEAFAFPRAMHGRAGHDLSFSGLKTALLQRVRELGADGVAARRADLAASFQRAVVDTLVERAIGAVEARAARRLALVGGVAANSVLRDALADACAARGVALHLAPLPLCADNAAMIAAAALHVEPLVAPAYLTLDAYARSPWSRGSIL